MPRTSVLLAKDWRAERLEQSSANPERSVDFEPVSVSAGAGGVGGNVAGEDFDFASDSSESSFAEGGGSCDSGADDVIDNDTDSDNAIEVILHRRSRNLGGKHSICPQLMDLCLAGIDCWGSFFTSFRPFEKQRLEFEPVEGGLSHDEYLRLVLSMYKRYHKTAHLRDNSNSAMLERACVRWWGARSVSGSVQIKSPITLTRQPRSTKTGCLWPDWQQRQFETAALLLSSSGWSQ